MDQIILDDCQKCYHCNGRGYGSYIDIINCNSCNGTSKDLYNCISCKSTGYKMIQVRKLCDACQGKKVK